MKKIIAIKLGMSQIFEAGQTIPVTLVEAGPCFIVRKVDADAENKVRFQIGCFQAKKIKKPQRNHLKKNKIKQNLAYFYEIPANDLQGKKPGDAIDATIFQENDIIDVIGKSKGRGFAGVIKRHGFSRGPETHGSGHHRRPGSIGSMFPQRVIKGKKMPGHTGFAKVTLKNLKIKKIIADKNIIIIAGAVPGPIGSKLIIRKA